MTDFHPAKGGPSRGSILVISFSDLARDPRVSRQISLLADDYRVVALGTGAAVAAGVPTALVELEGPSLPRRLKAATLLKLGRFESYYWNQSHVRQARALLGSERFDLVVANDLDALPLALELANGAPVLIDAHEYAPREFEDDFVWRTFFQRYKSYLCRRYLPLASGMVTVCHGIAAEYAKNFGVQAEVVWNAPLYKELQPGPVAEDSVRLIHHGIAHPSRKLETMIAIMDRLDARFSLDFMLMPSRPDYLAELRGKSAHNPRIRFLDPVPMPQICGFINAYDLGIFLLEPVNFNYRHALPNKLFEFVQARLGIAIGPSPEMARLVEQHRLGVVADSFAPADLAGRLNALTSRDITALKSAAHAAAAQLCFEESSSKILRSEVARLIEGGKRRCAA